ncbi:MAG TPA: poly(A) polymerase, partial [Psychrobacter sp.]|nr:poly(A) polymerase [Psychrobacter sp.]
SRRRRASQHTSANDKGYSPQQVKQDNNELAQLQQLSLASRNDGSNQQQYTSKPAPLFVIEHGNVVPPLQKQLSASDKPFSKATEKATLQKVLEQETVGEKLPADNQSQSQEKSANKANDLSNRAHEPKASVDTHASSNNARSSAYAERNVAQSPALVSMNNEPIPHKRRRRQPTEAENTVTKNTETKNTGTVAKANGAKKVVSIDSNSNEKAADKYAKKSPKPADNSTDNAIAKAPKPVKAKRDANSQSANNQSANNQSVNNQSVNNQSANGHIDANKAVNSNMNANKGPVPSKRRRRQPSTDDI